jgi:hypothetical protein
MQVIDSMPVDHVGVDPRTLVLCSGDIADIPADIQLQYLAIACTPGDYAPEGNPVVAELEQLGVRLAAAEKNFLQHDFRPSIPCWATRAFSLADAHFRHLLVWEPVFADDATTGLKDVHFAFQALSRLHGCAGGHSAMFLLWPTIADDTPADMFRMQFFSAMALAGRAAWEHLYLMVPQAMADAAAGWFAAFKTLYADPPLYPPNSAVSALHWVPQTLSQLSVRPSEDERLTDRQYRAIHQYTIGAYAASRKALRHNNPRHPDFIAMQPLIEATSTGLACLPNHAGDAVIRAFDLREHPEDYYHDGAETLELAYCSTSLIRLNYGDWTLYLHGALGKYIAPYSFFPTEYEVLFDYDMTLVVTDVKPVGEKNGEVMSFERIPADVGIRETHL